MELSMLTKHFKSNQKGFTLIELIAVMVIMVVMTSAGVKKFDILTDSADLTAIKAGIRELNTQETLVWTQMKLSDAGWTTDVDVYNTVEKNLGQGYRWNPGPAINGGTLQYKSQSVTLVRNQSTRHTVGSWN